MALLLNTQMKPYTTEKTMAFYLWPMTQILQYGSAKKSAAKLWL
jgi:hypothetical protein